MAKAPEADESESGGATRRLQALVEFVGKFAPAIGERYETGYGPALEDDAPAEVLAARDAALVVAFEALARIARSS